MSASLSNVSSTHEYQIPEKAFGKVYFCTYRSTYNDNNFVWWVVQQWIGFYEVDFILGASVYVSLGGENDLKRW